MPAQVARALVSGFTGDPHAALRVVRDAGPSSLKAPAEVLLQVMAADYDGASRSAGSLRPSGDRQVDLLATSVRSLTGVLCEARPPAPLDVRAVSLAGPLTTLIGFVAAEAAIAAGEIVQAEELARRFLARPAAPSAFRTWTRVVRARALCYLARPDEAADEAASARRESASWPVGQLVAASLDALMAGAAGRTDDLGLACERLRVHSPAPSSYAEALAFTLASVSQSACGHPVAAAEIAMHGAGGEGLSLLPLVLKAHACDLLVESYLAQDRVDLAADQVRFAESLRLPRDTLGEAAVQRARGRVRLATQEAGAVGRGGENFLVRLRLLEEFADAARDPRWLDELSRLVARSDLRDVSEWADRALRSTGRDLRQFPAIGWDRLTARQRVIAHLAAQGLRNKDIAQTLFLSERTVENHVSAVLAALGSTGRVGIGGRLPVSIGDVPAAQLTPRQREVASLVAEGLSNAEIAARLGIGTKAVEKQLARLFATYGVRSRSAVAASFRASGGAAVR